MQTDPSLVVRSVAALIAQDDDVAKSFLLAAIYVRAITDESSPRSVADALFTALPSDAAWPALRDAILGVVEDAGS